MTAVTLFRPHAVAHRRFGDQAGVALPLAPPPALLAWALVTGVLAGLGFATLRGYARTEHVTGYLAPASGVVRVLPPRAGLIGDIGVRDGALVRAGDTLLTLRTGGVDGSGADVDDGILAALHAQRDRIAEQIALEHARAADERARLAGQLASLADELAGLRASLALQALRTRLSLDQVDAARRLAATGNLSRVELQRRQDTALAQQQAALDLARAMAAKRSEMDQARHEAATLPDGSAGRVAALRAQQAELDTRIAETQGSRATLILAPVAGRVSALQARAGQLADPAIPLLAIVPQGEALRAELLIPARAIGEIRPGQAVRFSLDAFPVARFGLQAGTVASVSHTLLRPAEILGPVVPVGPGYRATVALRRQNIALRDGALPLEADMTVAADIVIERRSLLGWLLAPLRDAPGATP